MQDVIVLGYSYTSCLCVIRSLGEAGYGSRLLALSLPAYRIAGSSKYVKSRTRAEQEFFSIYQALEKLRGKENKMLIIPVHDLSSKLLDANADKLKEHYCFPQIDGHAGKISLFMDKMRQKKLAMECGLPVAYGKSYSTDKYGIELAVQEAQYPVFQKPLASADTKSVKMLFSKCKDEIELRKAMQNAACNQCQNVLLEQYLEIDQELSAYGVAGNGRVFLPAAMKMLRDGSGRHKGVAAEGIITSASVFGEMKPQMEEFVRRIGLTGLFCIDLIKSQGKLYFSEINLRGGGSGYGVTLAGANLHKTLIELIELHADNGPEDIHHEVHFLNELIELDSYIEGFISLNEYRIHMNDTTERFVYCKNDLCPWRQFQLWTVRRQIARMIKRLKGRN